MSTVIKVENLSKKYVIGHQQQERYTALRDVLTNGAKAISRKITNPFRSTARDLNLEEFWALKNISFEIKQGDRLGIIGRNGAGKSTLLKILSRITEPTAGKASIKGRVASLLEVGTGFHPELTGRENIYLNGAILGMSKAEINKKFDEIVSFAEVERFLDTPVKRYSSGMYVRLAFAVAAHLEPEILIVDEVLAVGDASFQKKCLGRMDEIGREGRTVLFVSHNMSAIQSLCDRVIQLDNGEVVRDGNPADVVHEYTTAVQSHNLVRGYSVSSKQLAQTQLTELAINDCELLNPEVPEAGPRTGDPLIINIKYSASRQFQAPAFVLIVKDSMGIELIRLSTMPISGFEIDQLYSSGQVQLTIDSLPLVAGTYSVDVGFTRESVEWIHRLDGAITFEVGAKDVYKSGMALDRTRGVVVVQHSWNHNSSL